MKSIVNRSLSLLSMLILLFMVSNSSIASASINTQPKGTQLAYFVGTHTNYYNNPSYYRPQNGYYNNRYYHRRPHFYWTNWYYSNHHCSKSCLVNGWNGTIVRCTRRC